MKTNTYNTKGENLPLHHPYRRETLFMTQGDVGLFFSDMTRRGDYVTIWIKPEWCESHDFIKDYRATIRNQTTMRELEDWWQFESNDLHEVLEQVQIATAHDIVFVRPCDYVLGLLKPKVETKMRFDGGVVYDKPSRRRMKANMAAIQGELF